jgi:ribose transport system ATP-binding protein
MRAAEPMSGPAPPPSTSEGSALSIRNLSKEFPGTRALNGVDLDVSRGEIHALCGGNGSGKSTLIKILCGVYHGESGGEIECGGIQVSADHTTPETAHQMGVRAVHQDLGVFPDLSVAENLALGHGFEVGRAGRVRWRKTRERAQELIERFEIAATPRTLLRKLSRAGQTQVAIARALQDQEFERGGLLILDEPTSALPAHEVELLLDWLRRYASTGQSILYVSHRLDEVLGLSDRVTVLRDGTKSGTWSAREMTEDQLIELIVGNKVERVFVEMPPVSDSRPALEIEDLWAGPLCGINLRVNKGEVVGVAGLLASGRSKLLQAVFGNVPINRGVIRIDGQQVRFSHTANAIDAGVALVPENRAEDGAFLDLPLYDNISAAVIDDYWRGLLMRYRAMRSDSRELMEAFGVKASSVSALLNTLSGGNQQKVMMARWLRRAPRLLLLDEPTQGVDVGARADIYRMIRDAVAQGAAALIVASDFEELSHVVDRAVVLHGGRIVAEAASNELNAHRLTELSYIEGESRSNGN